MEFELKTKLYGSKKALRKWPGYTVNMNGPKGVVCKLNNTSNKVAKVSTVALAIEKLMDKNISVCPIKGQTDTYVEYITSSGEIRKYIVSVDASDNAFRVIGDNNYSLAVIPAIFSSVLYNKEAQEELKSNGVDIDEMCSYVSAMPSVDGKQMLCACDAFYYAIGKTFKAQFDSDETVFEATLKRIAQGNLFTHDNPSGDPVGVTIDEVKQTVNEVQSSIFTEPLSVFYERCKNGEFAIAYEWNDFQKEAIDPLSFLDTFIPTSQFREQLINISEQLKAIQKKMDDGLPYSIVMDEPVNIQIMGKPGTGKTKMIRAIFCALQLPNGFTNCKGRSEEDEIEGLNKFINGKIYSIPTKFAQFFSIGGGILLEEINLPDPDILHGAIGQALVEPYVLKVDGYKEYKRHPLTVIVGTMNVGTDGTKPLNQALSSRFDDGVILEDVPDEEFKQILYASGYAKKHCDTAFKAYKTAIKYLMDNGNEEYCLSITLRGCKKATQKLSMGFTKDQAFRSAFISQIYNRDMEVALDLEECLRKAV